MLDMTIRDAVPHDAAAIARVQVETWHTALGAVLPAEFLAQINYETRLPKWIEALHDATSKEFFYVAETAAGEVVGFASGGPERTGDAVYDGELYAIYILDAFQRRGTGRRLTLAVVDRLMALGCCSMLIWVLEVNAAGRAFYEALGGRPAREDEIERTGHKLKIIGYGWADIGTLRARLRFE